MKWLLDNRTDFGDNDSGGLVGGGERVVVWMEGANHFRLMVGEKAGWVGRAMG